MYKGKKVLGLIPARGGSKRLPGKNLRSFQGKPLIGWTIEAALKSTTVDLVAVSTDNKEIERVSIALGSEKIISRPAKLASDHASSMDVLFHALEYLSLLGDDYGAVALLQPTSPLRTYSHIDDAFDLMEKREATAIIGMCETEHPKEWMTSLPMDHSIASFMSHLGKRNLEKVNSPAHQINGAIYLFDVPSLLQEEGYFGQAQVYAYVMERNVSVDIDTEADFVVAESFFQKFGLS